MEGRVPFNSTPDKAFVYLGERRLSFADVARLAAATGALIDAHTALQRGDRVAILMPNGLPFVLALLALLRRGVVTVPLNTRLAEREWRWQFANADCKLLLTQADYASRVAGFDAPTLVLPPVSAAEAPLDASGFGSLDLADDCAIIHTSGTTGRPKAALMTGANFYNSAVASALRLGSLRRERWLCVLPLYHVGGLSIILRSLFYGTALDLMPFSIDGVNEALSERPITLVSLVPTMLGRLLDARTRPWNPNLRLILLGGEAPAAELLNRCREERLPIATSYGLTEAASQVATAMPALVHSKPGTAGKPLSGTRIRIVDERGDDAAPNVPGEVLVKGGTVMRGYFGDPAATASALLDGWLHSGDIGYLDEEGDLFILQRRVDLIVSGGENVYPAEVEEALREHRAVRDALVFGQLDAAWGQRVTALVECHEGATISAEELAAFARGCLAGYKLPRQIAFVVSLPRTASGKVKRADAQKAWADAISRQG